MPILNLALYLAGWLAYAGLFVRDPWALLRPTAWFGLAMLISINGATAFAGADLDWYLAGAPTIRVLALVFPLAIAAWVAATPSLTGTVACIAGADPVPAAAADAAAARTTERRLVFFLAVLAVVVMAAYLRAVPLASTGLATLIRNPLEANLARESSLKLLGSAPLRYAYLWHMSAVAPVLCALLVQKFEAGRPVRTLLLLVAVILLIVSTMLAGARKQGGMVLLVLAVVVMMRIGPRRGAVLAGLAVGWLLLQAALITIVRQGEFADLGVDAMMEFLAGGIFRRVFILPYETGVWTLDYVAREGIEPLATIRPLALLWGVEPVNLANLVGLAYVKNPLESVSANTCFLFNYQAAFGRGWGWLVSLVLLLSMDWLVLAFVDLPHRLRVAFFAVFLVAMLSLVGSALTTALLSHGLIFLVLVAWSWGTWHRRRAGR